jgi:ParB-like chromosome segregation protein Spo0J
MEFVDDEPSRFAPRGGQPCAPDFDRLPGDRPAQTRPREPAAAQQEAIRQIANSIETFGFNVPVLVDAELNVIAGHGRLLACRELGWSEVPTLCLDHLTPAQARAFAIADNRLTEIATWDDRLLAEQLKDLSLLGLDFSLEVTGFEVAEIDLRIASLDDMPEQDDDPADAVPEVSAEPPISQIGDLWLLGRHRVLCGNALDPEAFATLMGEERAAMVFTDPPYNVPIEGHASGLGAIHHRPFPMASGEMDKAAFTAFLGVMNRGLTGRRAAATASCHCALASSRRFCRVDRETRWR